MSAGNAAPTWLPYIFLVLFPLWWLFLVSMLEWLSPLARIRERFPDIPTEVPDMPISSARMGLMHWNRCIRIGINAHGLFLRVIFPFTLRERMTFIPFAEIKQVTPRRSFFVNYIEFTVGDPAIATMRVPASVFAGSALLAKPR
jgi:hypothetical protein